MRGKEAKLNLRPATDGLLCSPELGSPAADADICRVTEEAMGKSGDHAPDVAKGSTASKREVPPAALRALEEARARRARPAPASEPEMNGRGGPDPVRYGDWEVKGIASDF
jgi:hypothetical protein